MSFSLGPWTTLKKEYYARPGQSNGYFYWGTGRLDVLNYLERTSGNGVANLWQKFVPYRQDNDSPKYFERVDQPKLKAFVTHGSFFEIEKPFEV